MDYAAFRGWLYPGVPADARLVYCDGRAAAPAAAASVDVTGAVIFGGATWLYRGSAYDQGRRFRHRLLAIGAQLLDYQDVLVGAIAFGAAGLTQNVQTLLGLPGLVGVPFRTLRLSSSAGTHTLQRSTGPTGIQSVSAGGAELQDGVLGADWEILSSAAATVYVYMSRLPESRLFDIRVNPFRATFRSDGTAVQDKQYLGNGIVAAVRPEAREGGGGVELWPISVEGWELIQDGEGFGATVTQEAGGTVPTTASVHVRAVVAVWPHQG